MAAPAPGSSSLDVLIVDDDELICTRLEAMLALRGLGTLSVHSLSEASEALKAIHFPLIILDRKLSDGDGADLCRSYRAKHASRTVRIVILSCHASEADIRCGLDAGADDYISKQSEDAELLARLESAYSRAQRTAHRWSNL